ncbi:MAG: carbohydrate kinase family protein [Firmicutes bacterium]|nr:carbohydrate kinase family protein [Bacillota bacterium]
MSKNGIVVIGPVFVDIKGYPLSNYNPDGRNMGEVKTVHGGVSRNIVEDLANMELRPTFLSLVDNDGTGEDVLYQLGKHKVNTGYMRKVKDGMGIWLAVFDNSGDVVASISKRPDFTPILDIINEKGDEIFGNCDSISLEIDTDKDIVKSVFEYASKYGKKVYAVISNMSIAIERRDFFKNVDCLVCNLEEAGILFSEDYMDKTPGEMKDILLEKIKAAHIPSMVVTMGAEGAVYAEISGENGECSALKVDVVDTTGAGDAFFAGVCAGLTYGKTLGEACSIGARLSAAVIQTTENVCPRFLPEEFDLPFGDGRQMSFLEG